ncbi:MAG: TIGR04255 family protein [Candidatus Nitrospinota bacterium M3_3B_026]
MGKPQATGGHLADYTNPPLNEVVYGVRFDPLQGWLLPHIGAFWQEIREDFPHCAHAQPIGDGDFSDPILNFPLPRVWLISRGDDKLIQLQSGRFHFNWRFRKEGSEYPRYEVLSQGFFNRLQQFSKFVEDNDLGILQITSFELTYINHIYAEKDWQLPRDVDRIVNYLEWRDDRYRYLPRPAGVNWQAQFDLGDLGDLQIKLNPATRRKDREGLLVLELTISGLPQESPLNNMEEWYSKAHEWIVRGFEDLTSEEAQRDLWGKQ